MPRWEVDSMFYRVFCVSMLVIALTFTVILTNVFIDLDSFLLRKEPVTTARPVTLKIKPRNMEPPEIKDEFTLPNSLDNDGFRSEPYSMEDKNQDIDLESNYRTKRSMETPKFFVHIKNQKVKSILTNKLASLLEEMDKEETPDKDLAEKPIFVDTTTTETSLFEMFDRKEEEKKEEKDEKGSKEQEFSNEIKKEEYYLRLALHNMVLQGIVGHMDMTEVYKKIHELVKNFKKSLNGEPEKDTPGDNMKEKKAKGRKQNDIDFPEIKDNELDFEKPNITNRQRFQVKKGPKTLIKATIDIATTKSNSTGNENVKGVIRLIYNGKLINFEKMPDDDNFLYKYEPKTTTPKPTTTATKEPVRERPRKFSTGGSANDLTKYAKWETNKNADTFLNTFIEEYFDTFNLSRFDHSKKHDGKRPKRESKLSLSQPKVQESIPKKDEIKDDELYVEIETHFANKGLKGNKKKKLIKNLINKIKKAIHNDALDTKKKHKKMRIKKRIQDPLNFSRNETHILSGVQEPKKKPFIFNPIILRYLSPIGTDIAEDPTTKMQKQNEDRINNYAENVFKSNNDIKKNTNADLTGLGDYNKLQEEDGVSQRIQKPLNADEIIDSQDRIKLYLKEIEGSGFSVGIRQFTDEVPDAESMALFTSLDDLIRAYRQSNYHANNDNIINSIETVPLQHRMLKRDTNKEENKTRITVTGSIKEKNKQNYYIDEFNMIIDDYLIPRESFEKKNDIITNSVYGTEDNTFNNNPRSLKAFVQTLRAKAKGKPLNRPINRKKRSMIVKKYNNLKKNRVNTIIHTMEHKKKYFKDHSRHKRELNKIRIISSDNYRNEPKRDVEMMGSAENIYLVSGENPDRALVKEPEPQEQVDVAEVMNDDSYSQIPYDMLNHYKMDGNMPMPSQYAPNQYYQKPAPPTPLDSFSQMQPQIPQNQQPTEQQHEASLMAKYPHIFVEEDAQQQNYQDGYYMRPYEEEQTLLYTTESPMMAYDETTTSITTDPPTEVYETQTPPPPSPNIGEILNAISPKNKYKLTVKIRPKNFTNNMNGFKEIHTSINKSFQKNGLKYITYVNVSEISKVENMNKSLDDIFNVTNNLYNYNGNNNYNVNGMSYNTNPMTYMQSLNSNPSPFPYTSSSPNQMAYANQNQVNYANQMAYSAMNYNTNQNMNSNNINKNNNNINQQLINQRSMNQQRSINQPQPSNQPLPHNPQQPIIQRQPRHQQQPISQLQPISQRQPINQQQSINQQLMNQQQNINQQQQINQRQPINQQLPINEQPPINQHLINQQQNINQQQPSNQRQHINRQQLINQQLINQQQNINQQQPINQPQPNNQQPINQQLINQQQLINEQLIYQQKAINQLPISQQPINQQPINQQQSINQQQPINQQQSINQQQPINQQPVNQPPINQQPVNQQQTNLQTINRSPINNDDNSNNHRQSQLALLAKHREKIDKELEQLFQEKKKLERFMTENITMVTVTAIPETVNVRLPSDTSRTFRLSKEELSALIKVLMKTETTTVSTTPLSATTSSSIITTARTASATTASVMRKPVTPDTTRLIIKTIRKNENLTSTLLDKIVKNTEVLQRFLMKITEKIEGMPEKFKEYNQYKEALGAMTKHSERPFVYNPAEMHDKNDKQSNDTDQGIPFVYAYQQQNPKTKLPTSVVYHGHIHASDAMRNKAALHPPFLEHLNKTKFFIDDEPNEYKVYPSRAAAEHMTHNQNSNRTHV